MPLIGDALHSNQPFQNPWIENKKSAISKSMDRQQNISYAQAVCRRTAKEEIEVFKTNIINIQQLTKIVTTVL